MTNHDQHPDPDPDQHVDPQALGAALGAAVDAFRHDRPEFDDLVREAWRRFFEYAKATGDNRRIESILSDLGNRFLDDDELDRARGAGALLHLVTEARAQIAASN